MIILLSLFLDSFGPPSYGGLTMLLCCSRAETCNNNIGINFSFVVTINIYINYHLQLDIAQPEDNVESNGKGPL